MAVQGPGPAARHKDQSQAAPVCNQPHRCRPMGGGSDVQRLCRLNSFSFSTQSRLLKYLVCAGRREVLDVHISGRQQLGRAWRRDVVNAVGLVSRDVGAVALGRKSRVQRRGLGVDGRGWAARDGVAGVVSRVGAGRVQLALVLLLRLLGECLLAGRRLDRRRYFARIARGWVSWCPRHLGRVPRGQSWKGERMQRTSP